VDTASVTSEGERQAVEGDAPDRPTDLPRRAWPGVLKRTIREFSDDHLTDLAAA
jgi:membrane protein